jgi:predicted ATPase/class 3 adenylate cyclase/Tfp pilus assembly protein PilF
MDEVPPPATRNAHVLVMTDVVDSTRIAEQLGDAAFAALWAAHDRVARDLLQGAGGRELDKSDGFTLLFADVSSALAYLRDYHRALAGLPTPLLARAAVHVGALVVRPNEAGDIARGAKAIEAEGIARPTAARLLALAGGGQTLLSAQARRAVGELPAPGAGSAEALRIVSHGHWRLKGIEAPLEVFEAGDAAAAFAPPADQAKAYRVVPDGDLWRPLREVRHNLPAERDAFVGRSQELLALADRLQSAARLVSIVGAGGTGKTRFACRYGRAWLGEWPGGVWFCDLSEARSRDGLLGAVAVSLGVPLAKGDGAAQLGHAIAGRGRCLVILDNFEQVIEHAASTLGPWLDRAGEAAFVVTSRERLHLAGEQVLPLAPLPLAIEAVDLFVLRARAQQPDFALVDANRDAVRRIVELLDGLPLAIELAAARVRVLSPAQLLERLKARFQLLVGARGMAARQATLRAAIDWSWDLLAPWERATLAQCSVFEGGFTIGAAEAVLDLGAWPAAPSALDAIQSLVDKSLLRSWLPSQEARFDLDEPYFGMYISIHEYAAEKLAGPHCDRAPGAAVRHGRHFARHGDPDVIASTFGPEGLRRRRALARELDNLVAACRRALLRGDAEVAVGAGRAAWQVVERQGPFALVEGLAAQILALDGLAPPLQVAAMELRGRALISSARVDEAETVLRAALALQRADGERRCEAPLLGTLGKLARSMGRMDESLALLEAALAIYSERADRRGQGTMLTSLGLLHGNQGRIDAAQSHFDAALAVYRDAQALAEQVDLLDFLGVLHAEQGRLDIGRSHFEAALAISRETGDRVAEGQVVNNLGCLHQEQGRLDEARLCFEACLAIHRDVGNRRYEGYALGDLGRLRMDQGAWDDAEVYLQQSLAIQRETKDRRIEGSELRSLGDLYARQGRGDAARRAYADAEVALREVGDRYYLGFVLCGRGELEHADGDIAAAAALLGAAEACAAQTRSNAESELGRRLAALRAKLGSEPRPASALL